MSRRKKKEPVKNFSCISSARIHRHHLDRKSQREKTTLKVCKNAHSHLKVNKFAHRKKKKKTLEKVT